MFFFILSSLLSLRAPAVSCRNVSLLVRLWSEDADSLCQALDVRVLPALLVVGGRCRGRRNQVGRVRQSVLLGKHLPATVVALVGDVAFAQFGLQLPQVQPGFIVLACESKIVKGCEVFFSRQMAYKISLARWWGVTNVFRRHCSQNC